MARRSKKNSGGCLGSLIGFFALGFIGVAIDHWEVTIAIILLFIIAVNYLGTRQKSRPTRATRNGRTKTLAQIERERKKIKQEKERQRREAKRLAREQEKEAARLAKERAHTEVQVRLAAFYKPSESHSIQDNPSIRKELLRVDSMYGRSFEFWCADLLRKNGYANVQVTPGSGDQGVDIICEREGKKYAIQCKCYNSDLGNTPVQEVTAGKIFYDCDYGVVMTNRYFTQSAVELANKTGVSLCDRDALADMLYKITNSALSVI